MTAFTPAAIEILACQGFGEPSRAALEHEEVWRELLSGLDAANDNDGDQPLSDPVWW